MIHNPRCDKPHAGASHRARAALVALLVVVGAANAGAQVLSADAAIPGAVSITVDDGHGTYRIRGGFTASVSPAIAWAVLTDYDHIGDYVKSVRASEIERRGAGWLWLRQDARGGVFPLQRTVHVLLDVKEEGGTRIKFSDLMGRDFRHYSGEWSIHAGSTETSVSYSLEARPIAAMPHGLGRGLMGREARTLLEQVRAEMIRRDSASSIAEGKAL